MSMLVTLAAVLIFAWAFAPRAEGAHTANPFALPYPQGPVIVRIGGYVSPSLAADTVLTSLRVPFDAYVGRIWKSAENGTVDGVGLVTADANKNLITKADITAAKVCELTTTHTDVAKGAYQINTGDCIKMLVDTSGGAGEHGVVFFDIELIPVYANPGNQIKSDYSDPNNAS